MQTDPRQLPLDLGTSTAPRGWPKASRDRDPVTSKQAEETTTRSGLRRGQAYSVYLDVLEHPGATAGEIAARIGMERSTVSKRTADLVRLGELRRCEPRRCKVKGTKMTTWRATP